MTKDLDVEIERTSQEMAKRREIAEQAVARIVSAAADAINRQLPTWIDRYLLTTHSALTSKLGDWLSRVKTELRGLYDSIALNVRRSLDHDGIWQHRRSYQHATGRKYHGSYWIMVVILPDPQPLAIGSLVTDGVEKLVVEFLTKFGYPEPHAFERFAMNWLEVVPAINEYAQAVEHFLGAERSHAGAVRDKREHDAKALWAKLDRSMSSRTPSWPHKGIS